MLHKLEKMETILIRKETELTNEEVVEK